MQEEFTTVMVTSPAFLAGEDKRFVLGGSIYRQHSATNPDGEVFWITRTTDGVTRSSQIWKSATTRRTKWNDIMMGKAV
ncbi:hypothetical protein ACFZCP_14380 [Streptomyces sp. NPDC007971]|uniref:hypothetical protein n=1 Tax=Streptomyces sp. NPDC007971 TaxID=3364799 RepID=UPI0036EDED2D